jgi:membrane associated rhomboid family serine protease
MFLPIGDDNSRRYRIPIVVWLIAGVNAFVWYLQLSLGDAFTNGFSTVPWEITHRADLVGQRLINFNNESFPIHHYKGPSPIYLTVLSSMFMHGSWEHIIGNMVYLLIFADQIEDALGHIRFALFYILCGVAASIAHILAGPNSIIPCLGASGAIAGVLGAYFLFYPSNSVKVLVFRQIMHLPAFIVLGGWIVLQFISQVSIMSGEHSGVAYMAHIGGFVAGIPLVLFLRQKKIN